MPAENGPADGRSVSASPRSVGPRLLPASLRFRLLLLVLLAVLPALGLTLYTNVELRNIAAADAKAEAMRLARIASSDQLDSIRDARQLLFALSQLAEVRGANSAACSVFLARLLNQYPQYAQIGVIERDGTLFCSAPSTSGPLDPDERDYFQRVLETQDFVVSEYLSERVSGKAVLNLGHPILGGHTTSDGRGQVRAVVFASLDLAWLNQLAAEAQLPEGSTFTILDRKGTILVRYPDPQTWVGQSVPEAPIVEAILAQHGEGTAQVRGVDGILRLFAFTSLYGAPEAADAYVSVGIPISVAFASVDRALVRNLIGLGMVAGLALAAAWFGGDLFMVRWVNRLVGATRRLSAGDLSVRAGLPYREGELGQLARAFDQMAESLEQRIAERDRAEAALRESQQALMSAHQTLEQQVVDRTRELSALYDVTAAASASLDLEAVLERSLDQVLRVMGCEVGAIHLLDETQKVLHLAASQGIPPEALSEADSVPVDGGLVSWAISREEPLVVPNVADSPRSLLAIPVAVDDAAYVGLPLRAKGRVLGVLSVVGEKGHQFDREEVSLLRSIADQVGVAVENARLYRQAEQLATMRERQRLARELHDSVTQSLYSLSLLAEAGQRLAIAGDLHRVKEAVARFGQIAQQALREMRLLVYELRPSALQSEGLVRALQQRLDAVERRAGVEARLLVEGTLDLPASTEEELYRIVQEGLNNALKHAAARSVTVHIRAQGQHVEVEIADNGRGFDPEAVGDEGGMGLLGMRERAEKLGGILTIFSSPGQGTTVRVAVDARADLGDSQRHPIPDIRQPATKEAFR